MNSLVRVQAALHHTQPDRVPIGLVFAPQLWENLKLEEAKQQ